MLNKTKALAAIAETFRVGSIPEYWMVPPKDWALTLKCAILKGLPDNDLPMRPYHGLHFYVVIVDDPFDQNLDVMRVIEKAVLCPSERPTVMQGIMDRLNPPDS